MPSWIIIWVLRYCFTLNLFSHFSHSKGRSPVWMRLCLLRSWGNLNPFSHFEHLYLFSSEWTLSCCLKCLLTTTFLHILHSILVLTFKGRASLSIFKCWSMYKANSCFNFWFLEFSISMCPIFSPTTIRLKSSFFIFHAEIFSSWRKPSYW